MDLPIQQIIEEKIFLIRGQKVMLDRDLAELYGVETKKLNQSVKRNQNRFPEDFMFRLTGAEANSLRAQFATLENIDEVLRSQIATSKGGKNNLTSQNAISNANLRSQFVTSSEGHGGRRYLPYAFTEQGVAMLSSVLNSDRAVEVNIEIMRTFIKLRQILSEHKDLIKKIEEMEKNYDRQFRIIFEVIRELRQSPEKPKRQIGFKDK